MIRWNIQTPATRRQARWCTIILSYGLSLFFFLQICSHLCLCTLTTLTHAHTCVCRHTFNLLSLYKGFDLWPKYGVKGAPQSVWRRKKWWRFTKQQFGYWFLLCAERYSKKLCSKGGTRPSPWWADCKQHDILGSGDTLWFFYSISNHHKVLHKDDLL